MSKTKVIFTYPLNFFIGDVSIREDKKGARRYYLYVDAKSEDNFLYSRWIDYDTAKLIIEKHGCDSWEHSNTGKHNKEDVLGKYFSK